MLMRKRGELELRFIILLILGIIVLISMAIIFREQLHNFIQQITSIGSDITKNKPPIEDILS